ncbi:hypothetical protein M5K25_015954 [Dendrobium thyrsiflorum]|uniref:Uncharacterized protein n=1 Tax=Dendrobium thyrsiflorum TaxID=117978 RepID=A0ABD0URN7_DENTH
MTQLADDGILWRILQGVDHQEGCQMGPSLGSTFYEFCWWGRISGRLHQMSRPCLFVCQVLFFHAVLASKPVCPFAGPFRQRILGHVIQVSRPDEHSLLVPGLTVWMGGLVTTAELATQRSSFSSAFLMAFLQMRRPQHHSFQAWITRKADGFVDKILPRDFALILRGLYDLSSVAARVDMGNLEVWVFEKQYLKYEIYHLALKADGGGMDDGPDQDPMVPSSRVIVIPSLLRFNAVGEHTGSGHDRNLVAPFGGEPPGSEGPGS